MKNEAHGYFDMNDRHPELWGDAILIRDDDGMGFDFPNLEKYIGKYVRVTIEEIPYPNESEK